MSEKLDKLRASLEKEKERRIKINNRIESLERRIQEAEAAEVNEMVRTAKVTPEQLAALLRQSATSTPTPAALSAVGATFNKEESDNEDGESTLKFQRGDIYFIRLDSSTGSEQSGTRPAVILQNDVGNTCSPTLIVATLTSKTEKKATQPTHCLVEPEGLEPSIVQAEQIFTIDKSRVQNFVGHLTPEEMSRVDDAVKISLALNPMGSIQKLKPIIRSAAAYAPPEVVDGKPPVYPYTPIKSDFEDAETVEEMMLYTELQSAVHAMIQRLEYSFTFNPSLLTSPKRKKQVAEILTEAEKYIWRIKEEMRCA